MHPGIKQTPERYTLGHYIMGLWSRPRQSLARGQACSSTFPTTAESGTPVRARLIERLDERLSVSSSITV